MPDNERCSCAHHSDGSITASLCPLHAEQDPCLTMATVTGRRRRGSVVRGVCSACGWSAKKGTQLMKMHANLSMTGREPYHLAEGHEWRRDCIAWACMAADSLRVQHCGKERIHPPHDWQLLWSTGEVVHCPGAQNDGE